MIKINGNIGKWIKIWKESRQGCGLSPDLSSLYEEGIFEIIKEFEGIKIGGRISVI